MFGIENSADNFLKRNKLNKKPKKLDDVKKFFEVLDKSIKSGDIDATIIGKHIYDTITNEKLRKRKVSAINFEEFLTTIFEGHIVDTENREPKPIGYDFGDEDSNGRVARNKLEKLDVILGELNLSVKTLVPTNKELNIGSFSAEALFRGFLPYTPNEREELGSKPLLKNKFEKFKQEGKWNDFVNRFEKMVSEIFRTDWIITIKDKWNLEVYIVKSEEFRNLLVNSLKESGESGVKLLNRFEAHALRVEVAPILEIASKTVVQLQGKATPKLEKVDNAVSEIRFELMKWINKEIDKKELEKSIQKVINKIKSS
jgi:hypothetical protein